MKHMIKKLIPIIITLVLMSICSAAVVPGQAANIMRRVYEPSTGLVAPPTVIQTIDTEAKLSALATSTTLPQAAWFTMERSNDAMVVLNDKTVPLDDVLKSCNGIVVPILEVPDEDTATSVAVQLLINNVQDAIIASSDKDALLAAHVANAPYVTYAYIATGKFNKVTAARTAHAAGAHMIVVPDCNRETAEYMQLRFLSVTLRRVDDSADRDCVGAAVDCGANGVVVNDPKVAYNLYESVTKETYVRRAFVVGHMGHIRKAPDNSVEGMIEAFNAGADAMECDVYITRDNHVVMNHNGDIAAYTTDPTAKGNIETFTREQLKQYTLKPVGTYTNCKFSFLDEMFDVLKTKPGKVLFIEIKTGNNKVLERIAELAKEYDVIDQIVIISFTTGHLQYAHALMPEVGLARLHGGATETEMLNILDDIGAANASSSVVGKEHLYALQHRGITTNLWTVDGEGSMQDEAAKGAQSITTNTPGFSESMRAFFGDMSCKNIFGFKPAAVKSVVATTKPVPPSSKPSKPTTTSTPASNTASKNPTTTSAVSNTTSKGETVTSSIDTDQTSDIVTSTDNAPKSNGFDMWWIIPMAIVVLAGAAVAVVLIIKRRRFSEDE